MIDDTPSPARAGRLAGSSSSAAASASTQSWPVLKRPGKSLQQEEGLGQHVVARHRLELGNVERGQDGAQRQHARTAGVAAGAGRRLDRVAGVEQHRAALLHVGVDARERLARRLRRARHDRPIDQRKEGKLVAREIEADRLAGLERGALGEKQGEALQPGLADAVDLGVAGDDVGEPGLQRRFQGLIVARSARPRAAGSAPTPPSAPATPRPAWRSRARRRPAAAGAAAARCRRRARTPRARRARAARARRARSARADPAARSFGRPRAAH